MLTAPANLENAWVISTGQPVRYWRSIAPDHRDAPPLVFVHGFGVSGASLLPTATLLASVFPTFVPDLPGYGRGPRPPTVLSLPELRDVLLGFLDAMEIERAILVGHSLGGLVTLELARATPERVSRLVLVAPAEGTRVRTLLTRGAQLARELVREPLRLQALVLPELARFGPLNAGRLYWHMRHYPLADRLSTTQPPTLLFLGQRDPLVNVARLVDAVALNARMQVVRIDGAAHGIPYSHAPHLAGVIRSFMDIDGDQLPDGFALPSEVEIAKAPQPFAEHD